MGVRVPFAVLQPRHVFMPSSLPRGNPTPKRYAVPNNAFRGLGGNPAISLISFTALVSENILAYMLCTEYGNEIFDGST